MQTKSSLLTYKTISRQEAQGYLLRAVDLVRGEPGAVYGLLSIFQQPGRVLPAR